MFGLHTNLFICAHIFAQEDINLVFGETQEDNQSLVSFCCYEYHNPLVDAYINQTIIKQWFGGNFTERTPSEGTTGTALK